ncbi:hypothetical protein GBAR_LOCUS14286 [Geodia barretti]|uniref:Uncharacterized protein n=1 Tax=Geodia barretti TaxID=519541 RepID=A0AA35S8R8_GEOBA|nr:hypothetical protein GBAR_LOCUS14286 [Geodia barretti]
MRIKDDRLSECSYLVTRMQWTEEETFISAHLSVATVVPDSPGTALLLGDEVSANATQNCYAQFLSYSTSCLVNYESSLILHCPNTATNSSSHGEWWKQNPTTEGHRELCYDRNCTLYKPLHNEDNCRLLLSDVRQEVLTSMSLFGYAFHANGDYSLLFLHPPSIVCDPEFCTVTNPANMSSTTHNQVWDEDIRSLDTLQWSSTESSDDDKVPVTRRKTSTYEYETLTLQTTGDGLALQLSHQSQLVTKPPLYKRETRHVNAHHPHPAVDSSTLWSASPQTPASTMLNITTHTAPALMSREIFDSSHGIPIVPSLDVDRSETGCSGSPSLICHTSEETYVKYTGN